MSRYFRWISVFVCILLASLYIYPIFSGLILLPLDLLVSNSNPWLYASTILLKNAYMQDSIIQMFPWRHLTFSSFAGGTLPLWNPYQFMGIPFMAGLKPIVFYPANILFFFGEIRSWNMLLWLQLFLSLWFTYLFVRSIGVGRLTSFLSGIAYAFCSLMVGVLQFGSEGHVLLWLPLLLYFVKRYVYSKNGWLLVGIALSVASAIFAGQLQYFAYVIAVVMLFAWHEIRVIKKQWTFLLYIGLFVLLGVGLSAIQIIPAIELFFQSYRGLGNSYAVFTSGLLKPYSFFRLLSPDWFGNPITHDLRGGYIEASGYFGIVPLFFALYAVYHEQKKTYVRFFSLVALVAALFSMDRIAQLIFSLHIPLVTSGYGGRLFVLVLFSGAVLSAFGLQSFVIEENRLKQRWSLLTYTLMVAGCFFLGLIAHKWGSVYAVTFSNIKIQVVSVILLFILGASYSLIAHQKRSVKILFVVFILFVTYADLFRMGYRFLTFSNTKFLYPELPITSFVRAYTKNSLGRVYGLSEPEIYSLMAIASPETYNPLYPMKSAQLMQALEGSSGKPLPVNKYYLTQDKRMKYVLDFLGVSVVVIEQGKNASLTYFHDVTAQGDLTKIYSDEKHDVYANTTAYPRYTLYYDARDDVPGNQALKMIEEQSVDFRKMLLIQERVNWSPHTGYGSVKLLSANLNEDKFSVKTDSQALLYLSDAYAPGWHASVDGKPVPILHANYNFRAIVVPQGASIVDFWYMPNSFIAGAAISVCALGCLLFAAIRLLMLKKSKDLR